MASGEGRALSAAPLPQASPGRLEAAPGPQCKKPESCRSHTLVPLQMAHPTNYFPLIAQENSILWGGFLEYSKEEQLSLGKSLGN